ncbi:polysaccharide deacetylase family protein [Rhodoflexus caldus]|uniref:polysaccharide deacetylase family protein n=1 Tax=Rhodoflexus caldus TaxID=2891236 RepID=UPI00202A7FF7|nr:polysaccharide deacetylase family protein [Rhodoflexus caldus]
MPLPDEYLHYPHRRHAMDHERYRWSNLFERQPVTWPDGAHVALWVTVVSEFFPLNQEGKPFKAPGGMVTAYPDFRHYSSRDYGNRVGIFRLFRLFKQLGIKASVAMNAAVAERYPVLAREVVANGYEIICHGYDMDTIHHSGMSEADERAIIRKSKNIISDITGVAPQGWLSPASAESFLTPDLVQEEGFSYLCDWANDDMPYAFQTRQGSIWAMPYSEEISDRQIIFGYHHTEAQFAEQVKDQFDTLFTESKQYGGRILSLVLYPYISGLPYRIHAVEEALRYIVQRPGVWSALGSDIIAHLRR